MEQFIQRKEKKETKAIERKKKESKDKKRKQSRGTEFDCCKLMDLSIRYVLGVHLFPVGIC